MMGNGITTGPPTDGECERGPAHPRGRPQGYNTSHLRHKEGKVDKKAQLCKTSRKQSSKELYDV